MHNLLGEAAEVIKIFSWDCGLGAIAPGYADIHTRLALLYTCCRLKLHFSNIYFNSTLPWPFIVFCWLSYAADIYGGRCSITQTNRTRYTPGINYFDCLHMRRPLKTLWVCSFPFPSLSSLSSYFPLLSLSPPPLFPPLPCHGLGPAGGALKLLQWVRVELGRQTIFGKFGAKIGFDDTDFSSVCSRNNYYKWPVTQH